MSTQYQVSTEEATELEYAKPCSHRGCDEPAATFSVVSHSADNGCLWSQGRFRCSNHLEQKCAEYATWLSWIGGSRCTACGTAVSGNLEDNIRVIKL